MSQAAQGERNWTYTASTLLLSSTHLGGNATYAVVQVNPHPYGTRPEQSHMLR